VEGILVPIAIVVVFSLYFLSAIVAHRREHHNRTSILVLNIFLGWTFLGWVAALIWSFTQVQD